MLWFVSNKKHNQTVDRLKRKIKSLENKIEYLEFIRKYPKKYNVKIYKDIGKIKGIISLKYEYGEGRLKYFKTILPTPFRPIDNLKVQNVFLDDSGLKAFYIKIKVYNSAKTSNNYYRISYISNKLEQISKEEYLSHMLMEE